MRGGVFLKKREKKKMRKRKTDRPTGSALEGPGIVQRCTKKNKSWGGEEGEKVLKKEKVPRRGKEGPFGPWEGGVSGPPTFTGRGIEFTAHLSKR